MLARFLTLPGAIAPEPETGTMRHLIWIAILLAVVWVIARLIAGIAGALLNLLWIVAIIVFAIWLFGVITGRGSSTSSV
jgi:hypothetical protein